MREAIYAIVDVIVIICACIFTSTLSMLLVRQSDDNADLTPRLTIDRSIRMCKRDAAEAGGGNLSVVWTSPLHAMCAVGEVFDVEHVQCRIEYLPHDSYNPLVINKAFHADTELRMHACGRRLEALATHASGLQYTLIRSDALLASSVDALMLQRLTSIPLRTNMLQKRVHQCTQEQSLGPQQLRKNMLDARVRTAGLSPLQSMVELSARGCPSVAHVGVGIRADGYVAVMQSRPLPTAKQARGVHAALALPFEENGYAHALEILHSNTSCSRSAIEQYAHEFVNMHLHGTSDGLGGSGVPRGKIVAGAGGMLCNFVQRRSDPAFQVLIEALNTICVFSVPTGGYVHEWDVGLVQSLRSGNLHGGMHRAKRRADDVQTRFDPPSQEELVYATTPNVFSVVDDDVHDCVHTIRHFFTDAYEAFVFQTLVSPPLHTRIRALFARLQTEMQAVLQYSIIQALFRHDTKHVQRMVSDASLQLVGDTAPHSASRDAFTFAGAPHNTVAAMLEQAQRSTVSRLRRVQDQSAPCSMAPLFGGVTTNAYFLYPFGCVVVGSGVLLRPFADESYTDTALLMGIGFVLAHELGHALLAGKVDRTLQAQLFAAYPSSTYEEAIADMLAALAIVRIHGSREDMCVRLQQVWCAYVDEQTTFDTRPSHPYPHKRWEDLCDVLRQYF